MSAYAYLALLFKRFYTVEKTQAHERLKSNRNRYYCVATIRAYVFFGRGSLCVSVLPRLFLLDDMYLREETAVFIGNRDCYFIKEEHIEQAIICAINMGIKVFLNGGQGHFDVTCASVLHRLRKKYPYIKSHLVIPYHGFHIFDKELFDEIIYPFEEQQDTYFFYKRAIPERNKYMVEKSSVAICYVYRSGGADNTLRYAKKNNLRIIDLISGLTR